MQDSIAEVRSPVSAISSEPIKGFEPAPLSTHPDMKGRATPLTDFKPKGDEALEAAFMQALGQMGDQRQKTNPLQGPSPESSAIPTKLPDAVKNEIKNETKDKPQNLGELIKNIWAKFLHWLNT